MVKFTRPENDGHGAFHLEFVNQSSNNYGVGLGFLDGASTPSPFIMSIHTDGDFQSSNSTGAVAVSMAMDGTNFVGVNTVAPTSQLSVQSSPILSLNLLHNFGGGIGIRLISDDGNTVAILDGGNNLNLWTKTGGLWSSTLISADVYYFDMTRDGQNVVYQLTSDPGVLIYPSGYVDDVEQLNAIAYGGSSNVFVATLNNSRVYSFDGSTWNGHDFTTDFTYAIAASDDGVYAVISNNYGTYQFSNVSGTWTRRTISNYFRSKVSMSSDGQVICEKPGDDSQVNIYRNTILEFTFKAGSTVGSPKLSKDGNTFTYRFIGNDSYFYLYKYQNGQWIPCRPHISGQTFSLNYDASKIIADTNLYSVSYSTKAFNVDDSLVVSNGDITTPAFYTGTGSLWDQGNQKESADSTAVSSDGSLVAYGSLETQIVKVYKNQSLVQTINSITPYKLAINGDIVAVGTGSGGVSFGDYRGSTLKTITLDGESILSPSLSSDGKTLALGGSNVYVNKNNSNAYTLAKQPVPASRGTAVSSDGHWVAFGNHVSGEVRVYKDGVQFGNTITDPIGGQTFFGAFVSLNRDGSVLAVAGGSGATIFTRTQSGWFYSRFMETNFNTLVKPCLSGDGNHVILGAFFSGSHIGGDEHDTTVRAFNTMSGELDWDLPTATGEHNSIRTVISGDGNTAVIFYLDNDTYTNYIKVYDYSGPSLVSQTNFSNYGSLLSLSVTHDGQTICASDVRVIRIFDRQLNVIQIVPHPLDILSSAMSGDGQTLIVGQEPFAVDNAPYPVLVYKKQNGSFVQETTIDPVTISQVGYFGEEVAIDYSGSTVSITEDIQTSSQTNLGDPTGYSSLIVTKLPLTKLTFDQIPSQIITPAARGTSVSSDGHWVAFGNHISQQVMVYKDGVQFGSTITSIETYFGAFVSLNRDGSVLAVGGSLGTVYIYTRTQTSWYQTHILNTQNPTAYRPSLSGDGTRVVFGAFYTTSYGLGSDVNVHGYNTQSGQQDWTLILPDSLIHSVQTVISDDGNTVVVFYNQTSFGNIKVYNYSSQTLLNSVSFQINDSHTQDSIPLRLSLTRDGQTICASYIKQIKIFDIYCNLQQTIEFDIRHFNNQFFSSFEGAIISSSISGDGQTLLIGQSSVNNPNKPVLVYKKHNGQFVPDTSISSFTGNGYFGEETAIDYYGSTVSITEDINPGLGDPTGYSSMIVFLKNATDHKAVVTGDGSKVIVTNTSLYSARVYDPFLTYWSVLDVIPSSQYNASTNFDGTIININSQIFTQIPNFNQLVPVPPFSNISTVQSSNSFTVVSQRPVTNWSVSGISGGSANQSPYSVMYRVGSHTTVSPRVVTVKADTTGSVSFVVSFTGN
jgi:hypothetical protein